MRIWNGLKKPFWERSNQSDDDIISAQVCRVCGPCVLVLKTGMDIRGQVWRSVGKRHFFWSVLAAYPDKDLSKVTAGKCRLLHAEGLALTFGRKSVAAVLLQQKAFLTYLLLQAASSLPHYWNLLLFYNSEVWTEPGLMGTWPCGKATIFSQFFKYFLG